MGEDRNMVTPKHIITLDSRLINVHSNHTQWSICMINHKSTFSRAVEEE
jgi:hypothetical protein